MIVDELRALAAGATAGAVVPPSAHVRDVTTRAADRLELLEERIERIERILGPIVLDGVPPAISSAITRAWWDARADVDDDELRRVCLEALDARDALQEAGDA